jgi:hypothetical protein
MNYTITGGANPVVRVELAALSEQYRPPEPHRQAPGRLTPEWGI